MSSYIPQTNLPLERSRLVGMMLGSVSYGAYLLLTIQAVTALVRRPRPGQQIANNRRALLCYTLIAFTLGTIAFACNIRYTEMIWIDLRDVPGGPTVLIENATHYRINFVAICCGYLTAWFMQALLLYRCFVMWNWARRVMIPMVALYIGMIAVAIVILVQAGTGTIFYNINIAPAYLVIQVVLTVLYTTLVTRRLLVIRGQMRQAMAEYDSSTYDTVILMLAESAISYTVFLIIFIIAFAVDSNALSTICFLSINQVQGITQLFIIIRVARGRAVTNDWAARATAAPTSIAFAGTVSVIAEGTNVAQAARPEQDSVESYSISAEAAKAGV